MGLLNSTLSAEPLAEQGGLGLSLPYDKQNEGLGLEGFVSLRVSQLGKESHNNWKTRPSIALSYGS
jgi:hypothetical protein